MNFDISKVIKKLSQEDLFVSERHLQVAFILAAKELYPNLKFIPEYVYKDNDNTYHIDLMITDENEYIAVEFKYVVAGGVISVPGNSAYELRDHSALDIRRHQCVKDIWRLEQYLKMQDVQCTKGYLLLITNMKGFWTGCTKGATDEQFDIKDGGILTAGVHKPLNNTKFAKNYGEIELANQYGITYKHYKTISNGKHKEFKYLCVEVK